GRPNEWIALPNTPSEERLNNVFINSKRDIPWVREEAAPHDGHAVLVGGGPSLRDDFAEVRGRQESGQTIFALNGTAHWLKTRGIAANYQVILDSRAENVRFVEPPVAREYLIGS